MKVFTDSELKLVIPKPLRMRAVQWYHHYLQHPWYAQLEETLCTTMTWPEMHNMVRRFTRTCRSCQINKRCKLQYGKLPIKKNVISKPWGAFCVDIIGPYILQGKDGTQLNFMCLTMIDPASSWFEMAELPLTVLLKPVRYSTRPQSK